MTIITADENISLKNWSRVYPSYRHPHRIAGLLADFRPNILADSDNVANRIVRVFHAHVDNAAVVGLAVKGDARFDTPFTKFRPDVIWEYYICAVLVGNFFDYGVEFVDFRVPSAHSASLAPSAHSAPSASLAPSAPSAHSASLAPSAPSAQSAPSAPSVNDAGVIVMLAFLTVTVLYLCIYYAPAFLTG